MVTIYNPKDKNIIEKRLERAKDILKSLPHKHCFITGSYIFSEKYKDIDVFIITRSKKSIRCSDKDVKINVIDFNNLYSLFYHSITKTCIAKNILPKRSLKVTVADYWNVINEAVPTILNNKSKFNKKIRDLVLYTEYFSTGDVLDSKELNNKVSKFRDCDKILSYLKEKCPKAVCKAINRSYIKRYFYTQAGFYKETLGYQSHKILYNLTHKIIREAEVSG